MVADRKMKEIPADLGKLVNDYTMLELSKAVWEIDEIKSGDQVSIDYLTEKVNNANQWIKFTAGEDEELYETYRYRVFIRNGIVSVVQGLEYDCEKEDFNERTR